MNARDLIETAHGLTELSPRRPSQANLRRAQSTAYYASSTEQTPCERSERGGCSVEGGGVGPRGGAVRLRQLGRFHCLAATVANALMGKGRGEAWHQTYRALEHGSARKACQNMQAMREFPPEIQRFAKAFNDLQGARNRADYALDGRYNKPDVLAYVATAEAAIGWLEGPTSNIGAVSQPMCCSSGGHRHSARALAHQRQEVGT